MAALVGAAAAIVISAGVAYAGGGSSIASAPVVVFGEQQFDSTTNGSSGVSSPCGSTEWWRLKLIAGDRVAIDWGSTADVILVLYPAGTTDYTVGNAQQLEAELLPANGKSRYAFTANASGSWPLAFCTDNFYTLRSRTAGAYNFTATVSHAIVLSATVRDAGRRVSVAVSARAPDGTTLSTKGVVVTAFVSVVGHWRRAGRARLLGTSAHLSFVPPASLRGRTARVEVVASGPSDQTARKLLTLRIAG